MAAPLHMDVDADLVELVDERFAAIKRQHFPSYLGLLRSWSESLRSTEEWMVRKEQEFSHSADILIAQYQKLMGPMALQDHNYCMRDEECAFVPHNCSVTCWTMGCVVKSPSKYSSLSLPLLLGWRRVFMARPTSEGNRHDAYYCAPCGRRLRSLEEVHQFLESTSSGMPECNIGITNFTFDPFCSLICPPYNAKAAGAKVFIPDVACGVEAIPITCVNTLTSDPPEHFHYINHREAGPGVVIQSDPAFLVSCSCTDDCADRSKCECWLLTQQEARTLGPSNHSVGYSYGRLKRAQHSAIYECNSGCGCGPRCGNRVVQKGVEHHLQVFRTEERGWGLRTLRDIPAGSFICTYVGQIFPEHTLEGQGGQLPATPISDEYFAELDYIEVMEHHKEGYESEVEALSDTDSHTSSSSSSSSSEDESFHTNSNASSNVKELTGEPAVSEDEASDTSSSSLLSFRSLCSSSFITPLHSPTSLTPLPTTTATTDTITSSPPSYPQAGQDRSVGQGSDPLPHLSTYEANYTQSGRQPLVQSMDGPTQLPTDQSVSQNGPTTQSPTTSTASSNWTSHPRTEHRITSPHDYKVPISPRKLHGMRTRQYFKEEFSYIIDAKDKGNIGRYINHSCSPNMFVQNVFVDTHDLRFPWVAFFARNRIKALQELTWDYSYEVGSVEGKVIYCRCKAPNCRGRLI